jgi:hemoglobin/transferrin/lactoferrin receptor protein
MTRSTKFSVRWAALLGLALGLVALPCAAQDAVGSTLPADNNSDPAPVTGSADKKSTENVDLIYSVHRTPERPFDTPRAVTVITADEIRHRGARTLVEVLTEETGISIIEGNYGAGVPVIRGLLGKQIQILVDGVKLNNSTWRSSGLQYLNMIDINLVERIEIVRGVVSVLGTESLGGAINIVTKKGPSGNERFGVAVSSRYSTADGAYSFPTEIYGQGQKFRFMANGVYRHTGDLRGGGNVGTQVTHYGEGGGRAHFDYFPTSDKTLTLDYLDFQQDDISRWDQTFDNSALSSIFNLSRLQLGTLAFEDVANHGVFQFLKVTTYWNGQAIRGHEVRSRTPNVDAFTDDSQSQFGANAELRTYLGSHRFIYGVDFTTETISSTANSLDLRTGLSTPRRGRYTDGASYDTLGVYLLDHFDPAKWLTVVAGARWGRFASAGNEDSTVGVLDLASHDSDVTGQASLVIHATPKLNLVGSALRGFRAPTLDDVSNFNTGLRDGWEVPNPGVGSEHAFNAEGGVKYAGGKFSGSAFYFRSSLKDLMARIPGTFKGLSYFDLNGNGVKDASEPLALQNKNVGKAVIKGFDAEFRYRPVSYLVVRANCSKTLGDDTTTTPFTPLTRIPPAMGSLSVRAFSGSGRRPWLEGVYLYAAAQRRVSAADIVDSRVGPNGTDGFNAFNLRGGLSMTQRVDLTMAWENVFDAKYKYHGSAVYRPGSQAVFNALLRF